MLSMACGRVLRVHLHRRYLHRRTCVCVDCGTSFPSKDEAYLHGTIRLSLHRVSRVRTLCSVLYIALN
jgi:hypothetical protein